jgi:tRNA nucleotidyltransferase (CCA-adding enzyme)
LNSVKEVIAWHDLLFLEESYIKWAVYFMALIRHCDKPTSKDICAGLELAPRYTRIFTRERFEAERSLYLLEKDLPGENSSLYKWLSGLKIEMILYMMACTDLLSVKRAISHYVTNLRQVSISVSGKDLMKLGLKPGPIYREIMQATLDAKLNGLLETRKDELQFVMQQIKLKNDASL